MRIQLNEQDLAQIQELVQSPDIKQNPWLVLNASTNLALYKFLGVKVNYAKQLLSPPYLKKGKNKKSISVKSFSSDSIYPELKESKEHRKFDVYVIAVWDSKKNVVWLDGWIDYQTFMQDKNLYKDSYYLMSYMDLNAMETLK